MANLLIVENEEILLLAIEDTLSAVGHEVRGVTSGQEALEALEADPPDLVIADVMMPGMTGLQLLEAVHANPDWESIPFVLISAKDTLELRQEIAALGAIFLRKPFDAQMLYEAVASGLEFRSPGTDQGL